MSILALAGGNEFRNNCQAMDEALLALVHRPAPRVVILPTAAVRGSPRLAAENGVRHFQRLGAQAEAAMVVTRADAADKRYAAQVAAADVVYLAGGDPPYLMATLQGSAVWQAVETVFNRGGLVAGSSAGAMVLGAQFGPPATSDWRAGLRLAPTVAVFPHYEITQAARLATLRTTLAPSITLLGITEATACLSVDGSTWRVVGMGEVAVYKPSGLEIVAPQQSFSIISSDQKE